MTEDGMWVASASDKTRIILADETGWEGTLTFSRTRWRIEIAADQTHAMDSYNEKFTNSYSIPLDVARALRDWLNQALEAKSKRVAE